MNKFKIGDEVIFTGTRGKKPKSLYHRILSKEELEKTATVPAQVFKVTDVFIETCYGGTQVHYHLRPMLYGEGGAALEKNGLTGVIKDLFKAREIELELAEK